MKTITPVHDIDLHSTRVANAALNGGWTRCIPWPADALGEYGSGEATDAELDAWITSAIGVAPGDTICLGEANPRAGLSACAGRTASGVPCIRLSLHLATR